LQEERKSWNRKRKTTIKEKREIVVPERRSQEKGASIGGEVFGGKEKAMRKGQGERTSPDCISRDQRTGDHRKEKAGGVEEKASIGEEGKRETQHPSVS